MMPCPRHGGTAGGPARLRLLWAIGAGKIRQAMRDGPCGCAVAHGRAGRCGRRTIRPPHLMARDPMMGSPRKAIHGPEASMVAAVAAGASPFRGLPDFVRLAPQGDGHAERAASDSCPTNVTPPEPSSALGRERAVPILTSSLSASEQFRAEPRRIRPGRRYSCGASSLRGY